MPQNARRTLRWRFAWRAALTTAIVVAAVGVASLVYWEGQVKQAIEDGVADHLRSLEAELDLAAVAPTVASPVVLPSPERFVQVVTPDGRVVAASSELVSVGPLLSTAQVEGETGDFVAEIPDPRGSSDEALVMARTISVDGSDLIGIVGTSLKPERAARATSLWILGITVPALALLIGGGVWIAITLAMRPVNEIAAQADAVAAGAAPWQLAIEPDTVELSSLAQSLDQLLDHLRNTFESERQFLDDASHELRTPIAVARGELDLLRHDAEHNADAIAAVTSAIEELDRLDRLAADLLTLARARNAHPRLEPCDLAATARRAAATVMREPDQRDVKVSVRGSASAMADANAMQRVFQNAIRNAVSYCDSEVDVVLAMKEGKAEVTIIDDGPGFPEALTGSSFPRFAHGRGRNRNGTGLGLAIASAIVAAHGGTITADNNNDSGARVQVRLPAHPS
jgi:two-component system OmpR family sensor kinase